MAVYEETLSSWGSPPSEAEQQKAQNAERGIRAAISKSGTLANHRITVFPQGSYRNHTNVRLDSDVDVCVMCSDVFFTDYTFAKGLTEADVGNSPASYTYSQFKDDVGAALVAHFGKPSVSRGNKAFDVHENTYRVDADVVPCFEHRRYMPDRRYIAGTELRPDNGGSIVNWPQQNYDNGVAKNNRTARRFKTLVRIVKKLCIVMEEAGVVSARGTPGYLIECLVWNVADSGFGNPRLRDDLRHVLAHLFNETRTDDKCHEWGEINELKYLFRPSQPWTRQASHDFLSSAWDFVGFE